MRAAPEGFAEDALLPISTLTQKYHVAVRTVRIWRREVGAHVRPGAPEGNRNGRKRTGPHEDMIYDKAVAEICLNCKRPRCSGTCDKFMNR